MKSRAVAAVFFVAAAAALSPAQGQEYTTPLSIGLEEVPYPYPVQFLPLVLNKTERMAYMDVPPRTGIDAATAPAIVLLHGKNFWGAYWQDTINVLSHAGFRVVVPDQIGWGRSSKPDDIVYSFDLLARNTALLLDHLKIDKAVVVGHSMGGMLAVRFATSYPERVVRLVLENPIGLEDYRLAGVPARNVDALTVEETTQTTEQIRAYRKAYFVRWLPAYERFVEVPARVKLSGEFLRWARVSALTTEMVYQQPVRHELSRIKAPTLLVIGQEDRTAIGKNRVSADVAKTLGQYPALGRAAARDLPGARLVELKNVGHIPHVEAADAFHAALLKFLEG